MKRSADVSEIYIGVMSGTSLDGIDCVALDFSTGHPAILGQHSSAFPDQLKATLAALCQPGGNEIERLGTADVELGRLIAKKLP
jgi:anhydro-N-acetylmuramic acid kinase